MTTNLQASISYGLDTTASADIIWGFFKAVSDWRDWNSGVHACDIDGPFAVGSELTMVLPDQEVIKSRLIEVNESQLFVDETRLGDIVVRVSHELTPLLAGGCRITYRVDVVGDNADDICAGISADFPDVLLALAAQAEGKVAL